MRLFVCQLLMFCSFRNKYCRHPYMHACMHACMHAYIHTYIHTYTVSRLSAMSLIRQAPNLSGCRHASLTFAGNSISDTADVHYVSASAPPLIPRTPGGLAGGGIGKTEGALHEHVSGHRVGVRGRRVGGPAELSNSGIQCAESLSPERASERCAAARAPPDRSQPTPASDVLFWRCQWIPGSRFWCSRRGRGHAGVG